MQPPPENIPDNLAPRQYRRLGLLYALMGKQEQAVECMTRDLGVPKEEEEEQGIPIPASLGNSILKLINDALKIRRSASHDEDLEAQMQAIERQLGELGVPDDQRAGVLEALRDKLANLKTEEPPPREVPQGLSGKEYYLLGLRYKEAGWTEQARDALLLAIESDPQSQSAIDARRFLSTKIPRHPVPLVAEQTNIQGFNLMFAGRSAQAKKVFLSLIEEYPDFEWPYGNLGSLLIREGAFEQAIEILESALELNPGYISAWLHLARARALQGDLDASHACLDRVLNIDPDDPSVPGMRAMVVELAELEEPD
ncbi:MAG: tetratricopeptide repeat protein [Cyanobacteria bacterium HKST-UBA02]|nr:tetratricopeptide repeat protein [Cyanobacteria bacterium HKST-UBA02]